MGCVERDQVIRLRSGDQYFVFTRKALLDWMLANPGEGLAICDAFDDEQARRMSSGEMPSDSVEPKTGGTGAAPWSWPKIARFFMACRTPPTDLVASSSGIQATASGGLRIRALLYRVVDPVLVLPSPPNPGAPNCNVYLSGGYPDSPSRLISRTDADGNFIPASAPPEPTKIVVSTTEPEHDDEEREAMERFFFGR